MKNTLGLVGVVGTVLLAGCAPAVIDPIGSGGGGGGEGDQGGSGPAGATSHPSRVGSTQSCDVLSVLEPFVEGDPGTRPAWSKTESVSPINKPWVATNDGAVHALRFGHTEKHMLLISTRIDATSWPPRATSHATLWVDPVTHYEDLFFTFAARQNGDTAIAIHAGERVLVAPKADLDHRSDFTSWPFTPSTAEGLSLAASADELLVNSGNELIHAAPEAVSSAEIETSRCKHVLDSAVPVAGGFLAVTVGGWNNCVEKPHNIEPVIFELRDGAAPIEHPTLQRTSFVELLPRADGAWLLASTPEGHLVASPVDGHGEIIGPPVTLDDRWDVESTFDAISTASGDLLFVGSLARATPETRLLHLTQIAPSGLKVLDTTVEMPSEFYLDREGGTFAPLGGGDFALFAAVVPKDVIASNPEASGHGRYVVARLGCE